jgi:acyl dehydratase
MAMQQVELGQAFTIGPFTVDAEALRAYLAATQGDASFYHRLDTVPQMVIAGRTLGALIERLAMPAGSIHMGQELEFVGTAKPGEQLTCHVKLARESKRAGWRIMGLDFVVAVGQRQVLTGKSTVMLPIQEGA